MGASQSACCASDRKEDREGSDLGERQGQKEWSTTAMCGCLKDRKGHELTPVEQYRDHVRSREVPPGSSNVEIISARLAALEQSNRELQGAKLELEAHLSAVKDENAWLREELVSPRPPDSGSSTDPFSFPPPRLESNSARTSLSRTSSPLRTMTMTSSPLPLGEPQWEESNSSRLPLQTTKAARKAEDFIIHSDSLGATRQADDFIIHSSSLGEQFTSTSSPDVDGRLSRARSDSRGSRRVVRFSDAADVRPVASRSTNLPREQRSSLEDDSDRRRVSSAYSEYWEDDGKRRISSYPAWLQMDEDASSR